MERILLILSASFIFGSVLACHEHRKEGPLERAGERVDEISDNVREGENPLKKKGAMEKVGESIDEAVNRHD